MKDNFNLVFACQLDGKGSAGVIAVDNIINIDSKQEQSWVHLDRSSELSETWLIEKSGLDENTILSLLAEETRPRIIKSKFGLVAILRGVNTNPNDNPEDMVSLRVWCDGKRLISVHPRHVETPIDIFKSLIEDKDGPETIDALFELLVVKLAERMSGVISSLEDTLDHIEENFETLSPNENQQKLSELRKQIVGLRRYIAPQRDALEMLIVNAPSWLNVKERIDIREAADRLQRYIEALDAAKDRAIVIKDDVAARLADKANRTLYIITIISMIFLPLSFIFELIGLNFAGMPSLGNHAFWVMVAVVLVVIGLEIYILKRLKWI